MDGVALGADAEFLVANPSQRTDIAAFQVVLTHHRALGLVDLLFGERDRHAQNFGAVEQAVGVLLQAKDRRALGCFVSPHTFERTATVVQGVRQHVDLGVAPLHHLAIHPNLAVTVRH